MRLRKFEELAGLTQLLGEESWDLNPGPLTLSCLAGPGHPFYRDSGREDEGGGLLSREPADMDSAR